MLRCSAFVKPEETMSRGTPVSSKVTIVAYRAPVSARAQSTTSFRMVSRSRLAPMRSIAATKPVWRACGSFFPTSRSSCSAMVCAPFRRGRLAESVTGRCRIRDEVTSRRNYSHPIHSIIYMIQNNFKESSHSPVDCDSIHEVQVLYAGAVREPPLQLRRFHPDRYSVIQKNNCWRPAKA